MDDLQSKFVEYADYSDYNLEDLTVFIRHRDCEDKQYWIKFKNTYDSFTFMCITYIEKYKRSKEVNERISLFGNYNNYVLFKLTLNFLNSIVHQGTMDTFIIGIGRDIPDDEECILYDLDKTDIEYTCDKECPVCQEEYSTEEPIRLDCNHKVCRRCFFEMLNHSQFKCPICRTAFIERTSVL